MGEHRNAEAPFPLLGGFRRHAPVAPDGGPATVGFLSLLAPARVQGRAIGQSQAELPGPKPGSLKP